MPKGIDAFKVLFLGAVVGMTFLLSGCQQGYLAGGPTVVGEGRAVIAAEGTKLSEDRKTIEKKAGGGAEGKEMGSGLELGRIKKELEAARTMAEEAQRRAKETEIAELRTRQDLVETRMQLLELTQRLPRRIITHEVVKGENLWKIAGYKDIYNNPYKWLEIYHANKDKIADPDIIYPGQVFVIPRYQ